MNNKNSSSFFWIIIALILAKALLNQFDADQMKFEKPALAILYLLVFGTSLFFIIRNLVSRFRK